ncbi:MAG: HAMP domain-containing histidine kinase [Deltaproteobacteria bacterium]|nr:HAMP domain-containing histidine kinase [Deltaproteobacteria bacterium]
MNVAAFAVPPRNPVWAFAGLASVERRLVEERYLVVTNEDGVFAGLLTIDDAIRRPRKLVVDCVGPKPVLPHDLSVDDAIERMAGGSHQFLPVLDCERCIGVAHYTDLMVALNPQRGPRRLHTLAAGIAHDLNNLLFGISATVDALEDDTSREEYRTIAECTRRARALTRSLMDRVSGQGPVWTSDTIATWISDTVRLYSAGTGVAVSCDIPAQLPNVNLSLADLDRVLGNLVVNAVRACKTCGGSIRVSVSRVLPGSDFAATGGVEVVVASEGAPISPETRARLFEPHFSTDIDGHGLGLAIVKSIVTDAGGSVAVTCEGGWNAFAFRLPLSEAAAVNVVGAPS